MCLPSGANDAKALLLLLDVMRWKPEPSAFTRPTCAPPLMGSMGFLAPPASTRNAGKIPPPATICLPSGDQDGPRIRPFCVRMERAGLPSSTMNRLVVEPSGLILVTARCSPLESYAGSHAVLYISKFGFRLQTLTGSGGCLESKRLETTCLPSGYQDGQRKSLPLGPGLPLELKTPCSVLSRRR